MKCDCVCVCNNPAIRYIARRLKLSFILFLLLSLSVCRKLWLFRVPTHLDAVIRTFNTIRSLSVTKLKIARQAHAHPFVIFLLSIRAGRRADTMDPGLLLPQHSTMHTLRFCKISAGFPRSGAVPTSSKCVSLCCYILDPRGSRYISCARMHL